MVFYVVNNPLRILDVIANEWAPTFALKDVDTESGGEILAEYKALKTWDWSACQPPNEESIDYYMGHLGSCRNGWGSSSCLETWGLFLQEVY